MARRHDINMMMTENNKPKYEIFEREAEDLEAKASNCDMEIMRLNALKTAYYEMALSLRHAIKQQKDADLDAECPVDCMKSWAR